TPRWRRSSPIHHKTLPCHRCETIDGEHNRIETRQHIVCHNVEWLFSNRHYPGEPAFPGLAMISRQTERGGKTKRETRYRRNLLAHSQEPTPLFSAGSACDAQG